MVCELSEAKTPPHADQAQRRRPLVQGPRKGFGFVPFVDEWRDLAGDEIAQRRPELLVFGGEIVRQRLEVEHDVTFVKWQRPAATVAAAAGGNAIRLPTAAQRARFRQRRGGPKPGRRPRRGVP